MRFLSPVVFALAAVGVAFYNAQDSGRALVLPFVDVLDASAAGDPKRQGELTVLVLAGLALALGVREGWRWYRERAESPADGA